MPKERLRPGIQNIIAKALAVSKSLVNQVNCGRRNNNEIAKLLELAKNDIEEFQKQIAIAAKNTKLMQELLDTTGVKRPFQRKNKEACSHKEQIMAKKFSNDIPAPVSVVRV
jgi:hypothetical protein